MTGISTNARQVAGKYDGRAKRWGNALAKVMLEAVAKVEGEAVELLSGAGAPFTYPVPVRTGHLRRSLGSKLEGRTTGVVFNDARYAIPVHSGKVGRGYGRKGVRQVQPRPFLADALAKAKPGELIFDRMRSAL